MKTATLTRSLNNFDKRVMVLVRNGKKETSKATVEKRDVEMMQGKGWLLTGKKETVGFGKACRETFVMKKVQNSVDSLMFENEFKAKSWAKFNKVRLV